MSPIKFNAALTERVHHVEVPQAHGAPVVLRLNGMKAERANPARGALTATVSRTKPAAPSNVRMNAPTARVMPNAAAMKLPWSVHNVAAAIQEIPDALRGALFRGAVTLLAPRLAPLALPTVTLAATLYSPAVGDASLPFVRLNSKGRADAEGFDSLDANDLVQQGVPHTEYTRPHTPMIREHPIGADAMPQSFEGGPPVVLAPLPGRAQWLPRAEDSVYLATEKPAETVVHGDADQPRPGKEELRFSNVAISTTEVKVQRHYGPITVLDKRLNLNFQAGQYGKGRILIQWPDPGSRGTVEVEVERTSQLPDRLAGEVLAHALGYTPGFIPESLQLSIRDSDTKLPAGQDSVATVARWALALHGKSIARGMARDSGRVDFSVFSGFRATPHFFETPHTVTGHRADGPGLEDPRVFLEAYPRSESQGESPPTPIFAVENLASTVRKQQREGEKLPDQLFLSYVVPAPVNATDSVELRVGLEAAHGKIAQGHTQVHGVGVGVVVHDPNFGQEGGFRALWLAEPSGAFKGWGKNAKKASESAFQQAGLDGDGRWFPALIKPVSIEPFAGLQVRQEISAASSGRYEIRIPDARALSYKGAPPDQGKGEYKDLASMVIEPVMRPGDLPLARIHEVALIDDMWSFLPTFVGQALAAVQLKHAATGQSLPFGGVQVDRRVFEEWIRKTDSRVFEEWQRKAPPNAFTDGLTLYGIEKKLGEYSPDIEFVLQHRTESGDIEFVINPEVLLKE